MERALLVSLAFADSSYRDRWPIEETAKELKELVTSARTTPVDELIVRRDRPAADLFIGKGKAAEIGEKARACRANVVVMGKDLSATQQRNLEELIGVKVIDRTQLILDIFAHRARSQEGKVQVELAQLEYLLPRLTGKGVLLSRLGGGIGTRGPGEQKLEVDRRRIRSRIGRLKRDLKGLARRRLLVRRKRQEEEIPNVTLIGYTNVGKSTLLSCLTQALVIAADQLFTTLDPLARRLSLPNHQTILLSDTVGFLHELPHHLIDAFRATLEEVQESRLLLHVADASHPMLKEQMEAVEEVLEFLEAQEKQRLVLFNKIDLLSEPQRHALARRYPEALQVSAATGAGISDLLDRLATLLGSLYEEAVIFLGSQDRMWLARIYQEGEILRRKDEDSGILLTARLPHRLYGQLSKAGLIKSVSS